MDEEVQAAFRTLRRAGIQVIPAPSDFVRNLLANQLGPVQINSALGKWIREVLATTGQDSAAAILTPPHREPCPPLPARTPYFLRIAAQMFSEGRPDWPTPGLVTWIAQRPTEETRSLQLKDIRDFEHWAREAIAVAENRTRAT